MKVVINKRYGGFGISLKAAERMAELGSKYAIEELEYYKSKGNERWYGGISIDRSDPILVQVVEELGEESFDERSSLKIVTIPDDVEYEIMDYDGMESVHEKHRVWY